MTDLMHYEKGCSPSAIQRKYSLTYEQGYELAERLKKTQELEAENTKLKELLKRARGLMNYTKDWACSDATEEMIAKINQVLGEE